MGKILVYGCILFDTIDGEYYIGGCNTNVAGHAANLGMDTWMVSCVGKDALGEKAIRWMEENHIHTQYIGTDETAATGTVDVDVSDPQAPQYILADPVAYDYIRLNEMEKQQLCQETFDFMYFSTTEQRHEDGVSADTLYWLLEHLNVKHRFFDINLRKGCFTDQMLKKALEKTDILKVNDEELQYLAAHDLCMDETEEKTAALLLAKYGLEAIIVTRGAHGASVYTADHQRQDAEAVQVEVKDTVGAGDAFSAAFIAVYTQGGTVREAIAAGNQLGSYVAGRRSAVPPLDADIRKVLQKYLNDER